MENDFLSQEEEREHAILRAKSYEKWRDLLLSLPISQKIIPNFRSKRKLDIDMYRETWNYIQSLPSQPEEAPLLREAYDEMIFHRNVLVEKNIGLAVYFARKYINYGIPISDLVQEGVIGLINAAEKYDHTSSARFSTVATSWIRHRITRTISDTKHTIKIPSYIQKTLLRVEKLKNLIYTRHGKIPTPREIAKEIEVDPFFLDFVLCNTGETFPLDLEDFDLQRTLTSEATFVEGEISSKMLHEYVLTSLNILGEKEKFVLIQRFGLNRESPQPLGGIAQQLKISMERVRQIESKAISKLREHATMLKEYVDN